jgi:hypothetical protein
MAKKAWWLYVFVFRSVYRGNKIPVIFKKHTKLLLDYYWTLVCSVDATFPSSGCLG